MLQRKRLSVSLDQGVYCDTCSRLLDIKPRMFAVLHDIVQGDFDLKRMRSLVGKALREYRASLEEHPHAVVSGKAIEVCGIRVYCRVFGLQRNGRSFFTAILWLTLRMSSMPNAFTGRWNTNQQISGCVS